VKLRLKLCVTALFLPEMHYPSKQPCNFSPVRATYLFWNLWYSGVSTSG
jgi:hypothetical protein